MSWIVRVVPDAEAELEASARWYDEHAGLGSELVRAMEAALGAIAEAPLRYPLWRPQSPYRKHLVRRFPYVVIYRVLADCVEIIAFAHVRRRAGYWLSRT